MTELLDRLAAANPLPDPPALPGAVVAAAVAELTATPRRRRRRRFVAAGLAVAIAVPGAAAAMEVAGIHTGVFPSRGDTESVAGEEYLDGAAPGIVGVVRELTAGVPLPPDASWAPLLARWPRDGLVQRSGIGAEVEAYARCRWEAAWLRGEDRPTAARVLADAAGWRFTTAADGGGVVAHHRAVAAAAARGDAGPVRADLRANC